jgi:hypothetical protein
MVIALVTPPPRDAVSKIINENTNKHVVALILLKMDSQFLQKYYTANMHPILNNAA